MRTCTNCGPLSISSFSKRKSGYIPGICRGCERKASRKRRRARYADPHGRETIRKQNAAWRGRAADRKRIPAPPEEVLRFLDDNSDLTNFLRQVREEGYLPDTEDVECIYGRISKSRIGDPLPQSFVGLSYLDNVFSHRFRSRTVGYPSFHEAFHDDGEMERVARYILDSGRVPSPILMVRNLKFKVRLPSHFFPDSASALCSEYAPDGDVLDPFIGWGGRTLGAVCAGVRSITGTDLQKVSTESAFRVMSDLSDLSGSAGEFHHCDFSEYMGSTSRTFDLLLTSPPFLDTEDYGHGVKGLTGWVSSIMVPLVILSRRVLRPGGRVAIHAQDRPKVPVRSTVLSSFLSAGFVLEADHRYGKRGGQSVAVFRRGV